MNRRHQESGMLLALVLCGIIVAWPALADATVKVGLLAPINGPNPEWGKKQVVGMEMAIDAVNRRGGIAGVKLEAVIEDTAGDPETTLRMYRQMAQQGVVVVIGPLITKTCEALFPVTNEVKIAAVATASIKPGLSDLKKWPFAFRMTVTSDKKEGPSVKAWVSAHGIRSVVFLYDRQAAIWASLAETVWPPIFGELNVDILNRQSPVTFETGQEDFAGIVSTAAGYGADGICISGWPEEAGRLIREIRRQGLSQPILGASAVANPMVLEIAGAAAEDVWSVSLFNREDTSPKVRRYVDSFEKRCAKRYSDMNCQSEQYDVVVYDILNFLADIMKKKNVTGDPARLADERDAIRRGLTEMGVWRGTAGMMAFDQKGDGIRTVHVLKVKDGKWQSAF